MFRPLHWAIIRSQNVSYTVWSPSRHVLRPDDSPVQGPKHVVLLIKYTSLFISCVFDSTTYTILLHLVLISIRG
jgi:hypothetical protein